ncbi:hypothetical protein G3T14_02025 [Methylobacterium sp. BTF04]|uniref:hypothetical protein n=1 Tax=Methylobacterium sp. BTF04 TaxID=2708300 RepID=UPI0013CFEA8F|nr:hypothetical protein [Methylobacterium sp. BTF04]NEU10908.1 hypothetical protein [Methylobacterium sp. BTF04]
MTSDVDNSEVRPVPAQLSEGVILVELDQAIDAQRHCSRLASDHHQVEHIVRGVRFHDAVVATARTDEPASDEMTSLRSLIVNDLQRRPYRVAPRLSDVTVQLWDVVA